MEVWKDIEGYEGLYQVSNLGNVKSLNWGGRGFSKNLYLKRQPKGYLQVELYKDGNSTMVTVHRLVASAFLPNPNNLECINHRDENKQNNRADNLEWCTYRYNTQYSISLHPDREYGRKKGIPCNFKGSPTKCDTPIIQMDLHGEPIRQWDNAISIKHGLGINEWAVRECCKGNRKVAYGYKWKYAT